VEARRMPKQVEEERKQIENRTPHPKKKRKKERKRGSNSNTKESGGE
jgi:hypothetical protein